MRDDKGLDEEIVYARHPNLLPLARMRIGQVYRYVFDDLGRVVVHYDQGPGAWNLPGGSPEPEDGEVPVVTLRREVWEEVQVTFTGPVYIGYQSVHLPGVDPYARLRITTIRGSRCHSDFPAGVGESSPAPNFSAEELPSLPDWITAERPH